MPTTSDEKQAWHRLQPKSGVQEARRGPCKSVVQEARGGTPPAVLTPESANSLAPHVSKSWLDLAGNCHTSTYFHPVAKKTNIRSTHLLHLPHVSKSWLDQAGNCHTSAYFHPVAKKIKHYVCSSAIICYNCYICYICHMSQRVG